MENKLPNYIIGVILVLEISHTKKNQPLKLLYIFYRYLHVHLYINIHERGLAG